MEFKLMNKVMIYTIMVVALGATLLFLPASIATLGTIILCCLFVALSFYLNIRSFLASILPIVVLSIIVPTIVLIFMGIPIYHSFYSSAVQVFNGLSVSDWVSMTVPFLLSIATYYLVKLIPVQQ
jgi:hypothetical protein